MSLKLDHTTVQIASQIIVLLFPTWNCRLNPHRGKKHTQTSVDIAKICIRQLTADYNTNLKHRVGQFEENGNVNEYWQLLKQMSTGSSSNK